MRHTFIYKGRLVLNFENITSETTHYYKPDGTKAMHPKASQKANGLVFGYMEKPGTGAFAVSIGPVVLDVPLKIEPAHHTDGKKFGPSPLLFGNDSAKRLLAAAIRLNPQKTEAILDYIWNRIGGV